MIETKERKNVAKLWLPDQPGAWVMALFPALGGIFIGGVSWRNVWLLAAWTLCYCFQFSAARWLAVRSHEVKDARKHREEAKRLNNANIANSTATGSSRNNPDQASVSDRTAQRSSCTIQRSDHTAQRSDHTIQRSDRTIQCSRHTKARRSATAVTGSATNPALASRKPHRSNIYLTPTLAYLIATAVVGIPVLVSAPKLLWWIPVYAVLALLSFLAAWRRSERTLWGNAVSVAAAGGMALLATSLGSNFFVLTNPGETLASRLSPSGLHLAMAAPHSFQYFSPYFLDSPLLPKAGVVAAVAFILTEYASVVFVKTMFRKYGHSGYYVLSVAYHAVLAALSFAAPALLQDFAGLPLPHGVMLTGLLWGIAAAVLLLIAIIFPRHKRMKAMQVGGIEAATSVMNLVVIVVALM
ncbi:YwiC-like family protein [Bifidobacterium sp. ESL0800]|uniref:YwiC-like family protein n=1 Tax=Bifidobacterium sp. ESL0800 TaxID=2983236 RepID=UPI0023F7E654|nr:YwiC-like family protein [Bifidobacterium sp. ESL0800]WEV75529.1 YwiC-like family protein [Bifidobacterium sp. ESL0800]